MRILIAGCGYVGSALAAALVAEGHEVLGLRRRPQGLPPGVHPLAVDLLDPAALRAVPAVDAAVHAVSAGERSDAAYADAYVRSVEALLAHLERTSPDLKRIVFVSSTGVYAQQRGEWVDEGSPTQPRSFAGRRLLEGEARVRASGRGSVARLAGIYGPGRSGLLERVRRGEARFAPGPPRYTNRIHRDDAATLLRALLLVPDPPEVLIGVDDEPAPEHEVMAWLAERLGAPAPQPRAAAAPERGRRAASNKRCCNRLLRARGIALRHPDYRTGYGALIAAAAAEADARR